MSPAADRPAFGQQLHEAPAFGHTPVAYVPPPGDHERIDALARAILAGDAGMFDADFAAAGVPGPMIRPDPPAQALAHPILQFLHTYWSGMPRVGDLPDLTRVDPVEMRPALGYILLLDVLPSGDDFVYRLYGSGIAGVAGQDWTGWSVAAMCEKTKLRFGPYYRAIYRASLLSRRPVYSEHFSPSFLTARSWQRIVLPLVDGAGVVSRFLVGNVPVGLRALTAEERAELIRRAGPDKI